MTDVMTTESNVATVATFTGKCDVCGQEITRDSEKSLHRAMAMHKSWHGRKGRKGATRKAAKKAVAKKCVDTVESLCAEFVEKLSSVIRQQERESLLATLTK